MRARDTVLTCTVTQMRFAYDPRGAEVQEASGWTEGIRDLPFTERGCYHSVVDCWRLASAAVLSGSHSNFSGILQAHSLLCRRRQLFPSCYKLFTKLRSDTTRTKTVFMVSEFKQGRYFFQSDPQLCSVHGRRLMLHVPP